MYFIEDNSTVEVVQPTNSSWTTKKAHNVTKTSSRIYPRRSTWRVEDESRTYISSDGLDYIAYPKHSHSSSDQVISTDEPMLTLNHSARLPFIPI